MAKSFFTGAPPASNPKTGATKLTTSGPPPADPPIANQDPGTWPARGAAPQSDALPDAPGTRNVPLTAFGKMRTAKLAAKVARRSKNA